MCMFFSGDNYSFFFGLVLNMFMMFFWKEVGFIRFNFIFEYNLWVVEVEMEVGEEWWWGKVNLLIVVREC